MSLARLKNICKFIWILAVFVFATLYIIDKKAEIAQMLAALPLKTLFIAGVLVIVGKLCLVTNMQQAAGRFSISLGWGDCYRIYNLTQLAKYIPGSIWQFVGRISILRDRGVHSSSIRDSLLAEHLWVIGSAGLLAIALFFFNLPVFLAISHVNTGVVSSSTASMIVVTLIALFLTFLLSSKRFRCCLRRFSPPHELVPILLLTWLFLGASFWVTLGPYTDSHPSLLYVVGVYSMAFITGFLVPFAPAGLGVREGVLILGVISFVGEDIALMLAAMNRVIYFFVEIGLASLCVRWRIAIPNVIKK
ncbi:hypothetical protein [Microbulbifer sp. TYP-18]|uniref:hypothetical protein n=1 Tax=Microbulbifer sp. TYP-18 TaxID=3230024 RepID=UPI0034C5E362